MLAACLPVLFVGLPLLALFTNVPWAQFWPVLANPQTQDAVKTSLISTTIATTLVTVFGVPLGYVLAMYRFRGRSLVTGLVYMPLVLPPVVGGILLLLVWGQSGSVEQFLAPHNIYFVNELSGIILCQMFVSIPFVVVAARYAFERLDPDLDEAARTMGADTMRVFWSIALPLSLRAILAGIALSWMRAFGEFGATVIVAYHPFSFPVFLYEQFGSIGYTPILPMAVVALALGAVALTVSAALERIGLIRAVVSTRTPRPRLSPGDRTPVE